MSEQTFYGVGNLTRDPELRFTDSGAAVANLTIATTERRFDRQSQSWVDGDTIYTRVTVWTQLAENAAESLHQGDRVIVHGRLRQRTYESQSGEKHTVHEVHADEIGPSLRFATTDVKKTRRLSNEERSGSDEDPWVNAGLPAKPEPGEAPPF